MLQHFGNRNDLRSQTALSEIKLKAVGTEYIVVHASSIAGDPGLRPLLREKSIVLVHQLFKIIWNPQMRIPSTHSTGMRISTISLIGELLSPPCFAEDLPL